MAFPIITEVLNGIVEQQGIAIQIKNKFAFGNIQTAIISRTKSKVRLVFDKNHLRKLIAHHFYGAIFRPIVRNNDFKRNIFRLFKHRTQTITQQFARFVIDDDDRDFYRRTHSSASSSSSPSLCWRNFSK